MILLVCWFGEGEYFVFVWVVEVEEEEVGGFDYVVYCVDVWVWGLYVFVYCEVCFVGFEIGGLGDGEVGVDVGCYDDEFGGDLLVRGGEFDFLGEDFGDCGVGD